MIRTFGEDEDRVTLWLDKAGAGRYVNLTAIGHPFRNPYGSRTKIAFRPGVSISRGYISNTSSKGRPVLSMFGVAPISFEPEPVSEADYEGEEETVDLTAPNTGLADPEVLRARFDAVEAIELSGALVQKVSLKTGGLAIMMEQLQRCADALAEKRPRSYSAGSQTAKAAATRDAADWATKIQANYPSYLLREMAQASVGVRVQVNPEGRATFCEVIENSGPAGFSDAACLAMIRYSRFYPATDEDGNPAWAAFATKVTYRIN